jgi:ATP-dependent exoDNAse (exonuclease V) alpha subunit
VAEETDTAAATLERNLDLGSWCEFNSENPLPDGNYLVDEVSMMDLALGAALFNALRWASQLAPVPAQ